MLSQFDIKAYNSEIPWLNEVGETLVYFHVATTYTYMCLTRAMFPLIAFASKIWRAFCDRLHTKC